MKFLRSQLTIILLALACFSAPFAVTACSSAPSSRVNEVTTLKVVGASVDATMKLAAQLLRDGRITWEQWQKVAEFHDQKFQPAYNLMVSAVQANLSTVASPDLISLSAQLSSLLASFIPPAK